MKPSAPTSIIWLIALIIGILGIIGHFVNIPFATQYSQWLIMGGFILLALGTSFKGI